MPKLVDISKVTDWLYDRGNDSMAELIYHESQSGTFDPTPPVQPDIKPGDKVRNLIYGLGEVDMVANRGCRKYAMVQFAEEYTGMWAEELEVITDDPST